MMPSAPDHYPVEAVFRAISDAFNDAENSGQFPVREIDIIAKVRGNPGIVSMATEVEEARTILAQRRVHRGWKWAAVALGWLLAGAVGMTVVG